MTNNYQLIKYNNKNVNHIRFPLWGTGNRNAEKDSCAARISRRWSKTGPANSKVSKDGGAGAQNANSPSRGELSHYCVRHKIYKLLRKWDKELSVQMDKDSSATIDINRWSDCEQDAQTYQLWACMWELLKNNMKLKFVPGYTNCLILPSKKKRRVSNIGNCASHLDQIGTNRATFAILSRDWRNHSKKKISKIL